jgi:Cu/Ag efflux protein CusF
LVSNPGELSVRLILVLTAALAVSACKPKPAEPAPPVAAVTAVAPVAAAPAPAAPVAAEAASEDPVVAVVRGVVTATDGPGGMITIKHGPVPAMGLEADTTTFQAETAMANAVSVGEEVELTLTDANESTVVSKVRQLGKAPE